MVGCFILNKEAVVESRKGITKSQECSPRLAQLKTTYVILGHQCEYTMIHLYEIFTQVKWKYALALAFKDKNAD